MALPKIKIIANDQKKEINNKDHRCLLKRCFTSHFSWKIKTEIGLHTKGSILLKKNTVFELRLNMVFKKRDMLHLLCYKNLGKLYYKVYNKQHVEEVECVGKFHAGYSIFQSLWVLISQLNISYRLLTFAQICTIRNRY